MSKFFTLQQANQALGHIRPLMDEVQVIRRSILESQPEAWPAIEKSIGNGGKRALSSMVWDFERLDSFIHQILETGVQIKDINIGLLDFPALKDGREVCLCWQYGEEEIAHWHEVDAGYAGRQPIIVSKENQTLKVFHQGAGDLDHERDSVQFKCQLV